MRFCLLVLPWEDSGLANFRGEGKVRVRVTTTLLNGGPNESSAMYRVSQ